MLSLEVVAATLRARIKDIDQKINDLRCEQRGLEKALSIVNGESEMVEVSMVESGSRVVRDPAIPDRGSGRKGRNTGVTRV